MVMEPTNAADSEYLLLCGVEKIKSIKRFFVPLLCQGKMRRSVSPLSLQCIEF